MAKRTVQVKVSRPQAIFGGVVSAMFVVLGIVLVIPTFGLFGVLWTLIAAAVCGFNFYAAFSDKGGAHREIIIDEASPPSQASGDVEARLAQLRDLRDRQVITAEEYEARRAEIIKEI